jgi:T-complex protein 1 subunit gamma
MNILGVWEPNAVKIQTLKTAVEATCMLLRVDDIVSGVSKRQEQSGGQEEAPPGEELEGREM